jgi:hypothetical protein
MNPPRDVVSVISPYASRSAMSIDRQPVFATGKDPGNDSRKLTEETVLRYIEAHADTKMAHLGAQISGA